MTLGESKTVECSAHSQSSVHFQLLRIVKDSSENGGDAITVVEKPTEYNYDSNIRKAIFHFNNISNDDLDVYTCIVGNSIGYSTATFILRQSPRPVVQRKDGQK